MTRRSTVGRFAPSPTGLLHFGSLVSAVGSYLEARRHNGAWLIRIEDIDPPREVPGSTGRIIADLDRLGMRADQPILYQSSRTEAYQAALDWLLSKNLAYHCGCTRRDLPPSGIYPGTCRDGIPAGKQPRSVRFRLDDETYRFTDGVQGRVSETPAKTVGDFVILRADGLFAYQLAVVVDDCFQGVTHVVRGADLLDSTARQMALQKALDFPTPEYTHLPVAVSADGAKLSKRSLADPVAEQDGSKAVFEALRFLGQDAPDGLPLSRLWDWALEHWDIDRVPARKTLLAPGV